MNALVSGGNGFLGRYIVEQLIAAGTRVRNVSRRPCTALSQLGVESVLGDLRELGVCEKACEDIDTVFHVAGVAGIWGPWKHFYGINTLGTRNLVDAARRTGVIRFVYTSSPSVTFDGTDQNFVDETIPYSSHWLCHYPHSKALAEQHVLAANRQDNLLTCALRPHLIWGPRDQHLIPRLLKRAREGRLRRIGNGDNLIDMIFVENAAAAHLRAADALVPGSPTCGQAYFISQGEPVRCWDWINEILALDGLPAVEKSISGRAAWRLGSLLEFVYTVLGRSVEPPMTRFLAAQLSTSHYFNISRAKRDFHFEPKISTEEGMRRLGESFKER